MRGNVAFVCWVAPVPSQRAPVSTFGSRTPNRAISPPGNLLRGIASRRSPGSAEASDCAGAAAADGRWGPGAGADRTGASSIPSLHDHQERVTGSRAVLDSSGPRRAASATSTGPEPLIACGATPCGLQSNLPAWPAPVFHAAQWRRQQRRVWRLLQQAPRLPVGPTPCEGSRYGVLPGSCSQCSRQYGYLALASAVNLAPSSTSNHHRRHLCATRSRPRHHCRRPRHGTTPLSCPCYRTEEPRVHRPHLPLTPSPAAL